MATFTITGTAADVPATVTWTDGELTGDDVLVMEAQAVAALPDDLHPHLAIPGIWSGPAALDTHLAALATLLYLFDQGAEVTGDEPEVESLPVDNDGDVTGLPAVP